MMDPVVFREYDIRGVVGKDFDSAFARELGKSYFTYLKQETKTDQLKITIGHDARVSSPEIVQELTRGFMESGGHVVHIGLVTTPISYFFDVCDGRSSRRSDGDRKP